LTDDYTVLASRLFEVPAEGVTPEMRRRAKLVSLGLAYQMTEANLAKNLGVSEDEASRIATKAKGLL